MNIRKTRKGTDNKQDVLVFRFFFIALKGACQKWVSNEATQEELWSCQLSFTGVICDGA